MTAAVTDVRIRLAVDAMTGKIEGIILGVSAADVEAQITIPMTAARRLPAALDDALRDLPADEEAP